MLFFCRNFLSTSFKHKTTQPTTEKALKFKIRRIKRKIPLWYGNKNISKCKFAYIGMPFAYMKTAIKVDYATFMAVFLVKVACGNFN